MSHWPTKEKMKSIYTLAIIAALSLVSARADVLGSPKAQEAKRPALTSAGTSVRQSFEYRGGKGAYAGNRAVTNGANDPNLVSEQRSLVYTGKNAPRGSQQFEIAPVK